jgi:hypothetical protein
LSQNPEALNGLAEGYQIRITIERNDRKLSFDLLVYLPAAAEKAVPLFRL